MKWANSYINDFGAIWTHLKRICLKVSADRSRLHSAMDGVSRQTSEVAGVTLGDSHFMRFRHSGVGFTPQTSRCPQSPLGARRSLHSTGVDRWYVGYTQPNREFRAQTQLAAQGFRAFPPRYRRIVRHARKHVTACAPFFPRYLFVALDLSQDQWRSVNGTIGVTSLVMDGASPRAVPRGVIESLVNVSDENGFMNLGDALKLGERVRVLTGPFADLVGELIRIDGARRARVLLQLLGGAVAASIDRGDLVPARAA